MTMSQQSRVFDIVVFGATGFTGLRVALYLHKLIFDATKVSNASGLTMAIAGRNEKKLNNLRESHSLQKSEIVVADVTDKNSIEAMASQTRLIINCVGPFRLYGYEVVKACVASSTHYVDVSGEPEFLETVQSKFHENALKNNCFVVGSCGFDSIPADFGTLFVMQKLQEFGAAAASRIESCVEFIAPQGSTANFATWESAVHGVANAANLRPIRQQLKQQSKGKIVSIGRHTPISQWPQWSDSLKQWKLPFPGADASVVRRSMQARADAGESPLPSYSAFFAVPKISSLLSIIWVAIVFRILAKFKWGRWALLKFPRFLSLGMVTGQPPTEVQLASTSFRMNFSGYGYSNIKEANNEDPDVCVQAVVSGPEPGYVATPILAVHSALLIIAGKHTSVSRGGVLTPTTALRGSSFIDILNENGIVFKAQKVQKDIVE